MTVTLDLGPELDDDLRALARSKGVSIEEYVRDLVVRAAERRSGGQALALLREWESEDATANAEELARREWDWEELREAMNRSHSSDRILYP